MGTTLRGGCGSSSTDRPFASSLLSAVFLAGLFTIHEVGQDAGTFFDYATVESFAMARLPLAVQAWLLDWSLGSP